MNHLDVVLVATGSALAAAVLIALLTKLAARRAWDKASRDCVDQLKERRDRFAKISEDLKTVDAVGHEHLRWTLDCVRSTLVNMEVARAGSDINALIAEFVHFRDGLAYFDGYLAGQDFLAMRRGETLRRIWTEAHRELTEAADRISRLGWSLDGSSVVRSAMQEMAGSLRDTAATTPLDGMKSVIETLAKANRTLFAAMVEADTSK